MPRITMPEDVDVPAMIERMCQTTGTKHITGLATVLGVTSQAITAAKTRRCISLASFISAAKLAYERSGVSMEYLVYGVEPAAKEQIKTKLTDTPTPDLKGTVSEKDRLMIIDALSALKREHVRAYEIASEVAAKKGRKLPDPSDFQIPQIHATARRFGGFAR